jgi:hypothetical protein
VQPSGGLALALGGLAGAIIFVIAALLIGQSS